MPSSSNGWSLYLFNIDVNVKHLIQLTSIQDIKSGNPNSHKTTHPANNFKRSISIFFLRNIFNYPPLNILPDSLPAKEYRIDLNAFHHHPSSNEMCLTVLCKNGQDCEKPCSADLSIKTREKSGDFRTTAA